MHVKVSIHLKLYDYLHLSSELCMHFTPLAPICVAFEEEVSILAHFYWLPQEKPVSKRPLLLLLLLLLVVLVITFFGCPMVLSFRLRYGAKL